MAAPCYRATRSTCAEPSRMLALDPLLLVDAGLRGTLLALLLLMAGLLLRDRPRLPLAQACAALCLGLCVQAVSSTPLFEAAVPRLWQAPWVGVSVANVVLFWVFVQALFDDEFAFRPVHGFAWLAVAALGWLNCAVLAGTASALASVSLGLQRGVPLLFAVLATVAAAAHWRADLVEGRRRLRVFIVVTGVVYTLALLAARLASPSGRLSEPLATMDVAFLLFMVSVVAWRMLRMGPSELLPEPLAGPGMTPCGPDRGTASFRGSAVRLSDPPVPAAPGAEPPPVEQRLAAMPEPDVAESRLAGSLQRLMSEERAYRSEDLTVASLALRLSVPEYRLRRLINQRLGHRNFNVFVNGYRLDEARRVLADPGQRGRPVLTIALDAGFQSIGPFNRAFKAATGLTPTEFRRQMLADS